MTGIHSHGQTLLDNLPQNTEHSLHPIFGLTSERTSALP